MDKIRQNFVEFCSGAVGGAASLVVGHPFDTVKTVTQNSNRKMTITEGIDGLGSQGYKTFYRGLSMPLLSCGLVNAHVFMSHKFLQRIINPDGTSTSANAVSGAFAGIIQLIPGTPVEVIKINMQSDTLKQGSLPQKGPVTYVKEIWNRDGIRGVYKGVGIHALRDIPAFIIYFSSYESCKDFANRKDWANPTARAFGSGAIAGALSWVLLIPLDVMKTRIQAGVDKDIRESCKALRKIGRDSFFRGGTMLTLRAMLVNGITCMVYEECSKKLQKKS